MDSFISFLAILAFVGIALWMNQRRIKKERKANPIGPYVLRASHGWQEAPASMRNLLLDSADTAEAERDRLILLQWYQLPDYAQTGLVRLQIITEETISDSRSMAELQKEIEEKRHG